jgi:glyoxylase-like metal-dependent hydrolase (beta-lactamase superfamily II)
MSTIQPLARGLAARHRRAGAGLRRCHEAGRSAVMAALAAGGLAGGGEGIDAGFRPDRTLADGETIVGDGWALEVLHTPGHLGNHIALGWGTPV